MRMRALWMMVMVCFSDGEDTECSGGPVISVTESSKVKVPCPHIQASEMNYQLIINDKPICEVCLDKNQTAQFEVTASESGVYSCITEKIYPPPYKKSCQRIQVNVTDGKALTSVNESNLPVKDCQCNPPLIPEVVMWAGSCALLVYSLTITCITIAIWKKQKKEEMDSVVYENTRPRDFRRSPKL